MARPTQFDHPKRSIGISLLPEVWDRIDFLAAAGGNTRNQLIELHAMGTFASDLMPPAMRKRWQKYRAQLEAA